MWNKSFADGKLTIDMELTTNCNAKCPQCSRTDELNNSQRKSWLPLIQVSLAKFQKWFPVEDLSHIKNFHFSGTYGDPGMAKDLLDILKYIIDNGKSTVSINTNGGMRDETFWWKVGAVGGKRTTIVFDVDGVDQDMHSFYRQNVNLSKVLSNMQAALETEAKIRVLTVIFKHNQDYVEQIQNMCRSLGVKHFDTVQGNNFKSPIYSFIDQNGTPQQLQQMTKERDDSKRPTRRVRDYRYLKLTDTYTEISCMAADRNNVKVSAHGLVIPCCHIGPGVEALTEYRNNPQTHHQAITNTGVAGDKTAAIIQNFVDHKNDHNLNNKTMSEIINSKWYTELLVSSFKDPEARAYGCLKVCGKNVSSSR